MPPTARSRISARVAKHLLELVAPNDLASLVIGAQAVKERRYGAAITALESAGGDTFAGITGGILRAWALIGEGRTADADAALSEIGQGWARGFPRLPPRRDGRHRGR